MRRTVIAAAIGLTAVAALAVTFVWQAERTETERVHRESAVKLALPVIEVAFEAALSRDAAEVTQANLRRTLQSGPADYLQFISSVRGMMPWRQRLGHDFTWRGKRYRWPTNPYTGRPMKEGTGPGDFAIRFAWWGYVSGPPDAFHLIGFGDGGRPLITLSSSIN